MLNVSDVSKIPSFGQIRVNMPDARLFIWTSTKDKWKHGNIRTPCNKYFRWQKVLGFNNRLFWINTHLTFRNNEFEEFDKHVFSTMLVGLISWFVIICRVRRRTQKISIILTSPCDTLSESLPHNHQVNTRTESPSSALHIFKFKKRVVAFF